MLQVSVLVMVAGKPTQDSPIQKRFALQDIIGSVEGDLVKSALSVGKLVHEPHVDRQKREATTLPSVVLQKTSIEPTKTPNEIPTKVVIDRVVVFKAPASALLPHIPTFSLTKSADLEGSGEEESTTLEATTIQDENEEIETTTKPTVSPSTTPTTTSTTTKAPIVELKEAEEDIQEKVAEVAADPIIFSSRV